MHRLSAYMFAAPALLGLILFVFIPFLSSIAFSLTNLRLGSPMPLEYVGFEQFVRVLGDAAFLRALFNNIIFALVVVPVQTTLALIIALFLNQKFKMLLVYRTIFFMPVVFPLSLVSVVWVLIFAPGDGGILNALLTTISFGAWSPVDFLHHEGWALPAIVITSIWQGMGFQMIVLLAGLQAIPQRYYEAAQVDGANQWQQFWHVTLPQLKYTLSFVVLLTTILAFRLFDQIQIMTQGGPNNATTTVMFESVRAAFSQLQVAKASAMTVILFVIVFLLTMLQRYIMKISK
ncbi:carbohydrate ABC transporter permease [Kaarinaea lacus]